MRKILPLLLIILLLFACGGRSNKTAPSGDYKYIGSLKSNKYHYPSCEWAQKIKPENAIYFKTKAEAEESGYIPCKVCKP